MGTVSKATQDIVVCGNTIIDLRSQSVMANNQREFLAPREFLILRTMVSLGGHPLQTEHLKTDYPDAHKRSIAVHLCRIRKKLRSIDSNIGFRPIRDQGYCIVIG